MISDIILYTASTIEYRSIFISVTLGCNGQFLLALKIPKVVSDTR